MRAALTSIMTDTRERDILVASNEYAYVQDLTKGDIVLYVGPTKISLSNTERLVDYLNARFVPIRADEGGAVATFVTATSSQYIVLENPPKDPNVKPTKGNNSATELRIGRKIVVPGPASFPLWPGQRARVVDGHALREDEYLVVRIYDEGHDAPIGTERVIRGTDTSFYIPETGLEVIPASGGSYVHKARRLRKGAGLHLRVVKSFEQAAGEAIPAGNYEAGQDVFIADGEGFFFPTSSVEVVSEIKAIPLGEREGIYARDISTGYIATVTGPINYLPDPTRVEVVVRPLDDDRAELYGVPKNTISVRALSIYVPSSFAVLVTAKNKREVVRGPQTRVLDYDEDLEVLQLSTGKPKTSERSLRTCFLQTEGNKVSDVLRLKTADHNEIEVSVSYRVSFVGPDDVRWFNVTDYVGLLCDHAGSLLRAAVRACSIETFYQASTEILRTAILGEKREGEPRTGRHFEENGMWIYDVEILDVRILDPEVQALIGGAQRNAIVADVTRRQELLRLETERLKEQVRRAICDEQAQTMVAEEKRVEKKRAVDLATAESAAAVGSVADQARLVAKEREQDLERKMLEARVAAFRDQMAALAPELVATLKTLGHQQLAAELTKNASPLAILGGESVTDVVERLIGALPIGADSSVRNLLPKTNRSETKPAKNGQ
jgi:regulator of protease activity HflC (stomatin/prohibitin superfamily)